MLSAEIARRMARDGATVTMRQGPISEILAVGSRDKGETIYRP